MEPWLYQARISAVIIVIYAYEVFSHSMCITMMLAW